MVGMSRASETQPAAFSARHPAIVVTSANSPDGDLVVQAMLPLLLCLSSQHYLRDGYVDRDQQQVATAK